MNTPNRRTQVDLPPDQLDRVTSKLRDRFPFEIDVSRPAVARCALDLLEAWLDNPQIEALDATWTVWIANRRNSAHVASHCA